MKIFFSILLLCLLFVPKASFAQQVKSEALLHIKKDSHDFGDVLEKNGPVIHEFKVTNKGSNPLIIFDIKSSCGCTVPSWPRRPIEPGETATLTVSFNPLNRPGKFSKNLVLLSNSKQGARKITVTGDVIPYERSLSELFPFDIGGGLSIDRSILTIYPSVRGRVILSTFSIANTTSKEQEVKVDRLPSGVSLSVLPKKIAPNSDTAFVLKFSPDDAKVWGYYQGDILLKTTEGQAQIPLSANILDDFSILSPEEIKNAPIAQLSQGKWVPTKAQNTRTVKVSNLGKSPLTIRRVYTPSESIEVISSPKEILPGQSQDLILKFTFGAEQQGLSHNLFLTTNAPKESTLTLRVSPNYE